MIDSFVFDTNTLISAFLFPRSIPRKAFDKAIGNGELMMSMATYDEFNDVIVRPKFDKYLDAVRKQNALKEIKDVSFFIKINERITACRDPKDDKFLELAVAAKASCIITGDENLLVLNPFRGIFILRAVEFLEVF